MSNSHVVTLPFHFPVRVLQEPIHFGPAFHILFLHGALVPFQVFAGAHDDYLKLSGCWVRWRVLSIRVRWCIDRLFREAASPGWMMGMWCIDRLFREAASRGWMMETSAWMFSGAGGHTWLIMTFWNIGKFNSLRVSSCLDLPQVFVIGRVQQRFQNITCWAGQATLKIYLPRQHFYLPRYSVKQSLVTLRGLRPKHYWSSGAK